MTRTSLGLKRRLRYAAMAAAGMVTPGLGLAQDTHERVYQLEEQLKSVTDELKAIKDEPRQDRDARVEAKQDTPADQGAQDAATAAASQTAELKDRVQALSQRADQTPTGGLANGLGFADRRGRWLARFTGEVQGDDCYYDPADAVPSTFSVRRARIGLNVTAFKYYIMYVEGEFITRNARGA